MDARIIIETPRDRYAYLWLKEVHGTDLTHHCARALLGRFHNELRDKYDPWRDGLVPYNPFPMEFRLAPAKAYYVCGVTEDFIWSRNAHLAFVPDESEGWRSHTNQGITVRTLGLSRVTFGESDIDPKDPNRGRREYRTCRNWQFAHWLAARSPKQVSLFEESEL